MNLLQLIFFYFLQMLVKGICILWVHAAVVFLVQVWVYFFHQLKNNIQQPLNRTQLHHIGELHKKSTTCHDFLHNRDDLDTESMRGKYKLSVITFLVSMADSYSHIGIRPLTLNILYHSAEETLCLSCQWVIVIMLLDTFGAY